MHPRAWIDCRVHKAHLLSLPPMCTWGIGALHRAGARKDPEIWDVSSPICFFSLLPFIFYTSIPS